ncbi:MAG: hypothetical protein AAGE52_42925, partial [Myxococcota bacterium]
MGCALALALLVPSAASAQLVDRYQSLARYMESAGWRSARYDVATILSSDQTPAHLKDHLECMLPYLLEVELGDALEEEPREDLSAIARNLERIDEAARGLIEAYPACSEGAPEGVDPHANAVRVQELSYALPELEPIARPAREAADAEREGATTTGLAEVLLRQRAQVVTRIPNGPADA